ncbi:hypothetical protein [Micromonospora sp. AKA38]|uniref:hypothetical protein n=1 Tax=Micromonospora sp. AKA38 TaxID=2733861 RepID=UPI0022C6AB7D|nr:hypothetical protein TPA0908_52830 [Micromonospora sp. AKA38]
MALPARPARAQGRVRPQPRRDDIYLAGLLYEAMRDFHLNPHDGPSPQQMYQRFLGWSPFRRPVVEPPA